MQRRLFTFLRRLIQLRTAAEPIVILIDDLHWIDPGSDAFVAQIVEAVSATRISAGELPAGVSRRLVAQIVGAAVADDAAGRERVDGAGPRLGWHGALGCETPALIGARRAAIRSLARRLSFSVEHRSAHGHQRRLRAGGIARHA